MGDVQPCAAALARAESSGIQLRTHTDPGLWLDADPVRMRQALGNILSNALRHTPAGGTVTFQTTFSTSQRYFHVFINTDGNTATGFQLPFPSLSALGADYMIENDVLYKSRSIGWYWTEVAAGPRMTVSGATRTWTLPLTGIGSPTGTQWVEFHAGIDYTPVITFRPK
ncbi:sensor histidine kinase [Streptomyces sp. NPDC060223]|uniref:sensor histidine kinase n=1 Tax=unclassified Streptomyces TaxID=2593676 RepID=UPI00363CBA9E